MEFLIASCGFAAVALVAVVVLLRRRRLTEARLEGTWQSDGEATIVE
jgi:uncharacterized protein (TIGR03382 family)